MSRHALPALLLLGGCFTKDVGSDGDDTVSDSSGTHEVAIEDASAQLAPNIGTVIQVTWTTEAEGNHVVDWGYAENALEWTTADNGSTGTTHAVSVAGGSGGAEVFWRARTETTDGRSLVSPVQSIELDPIPQDVVRVDLEESVPGSFESGFRVASIGSDPGYVIVIDDEGRTVWWYEVESGTIPSEAQFKRDGTGVLFLVGDTERVDDIGGVWDVSWDQTRENFTNLHFVHHAFSQLPDGRIAWLAVDPRKVEGFNKPVAGDAVMISNLDGSGATEIWNGWDELPFDEDGIDRNSRFYPNYYDWTHANSLNYDATTDSLVVSVHNLYSVTKISLAGDVDWLVGPAGDWTLTSGAETGFAFQHNPYLLPNGNLLVFDNGDFAEQNNYSEASEYSLDVGAKTYERVWNFDWNADESVFLLGDVERFDSGNTLINWGASGTIMEVTSSGDITWQIVSGVGQVFGFSEFSHGIGGETP